VVLQTAQTDCGAACLTMLLAAYGRRVDYQGVREALDPGRDGVTALDLRDSAAAFGIGLRAIRIAPDALTPANVAALPRPCIAHWVDSHFVVIDRVRAGRVRIMDPAVGPRLLGAAEFAAGSTGVFLLPRPDPAPQPPTAGPPDTPAAAQPDSPARPESPAGPDSPAGSDQRAGADPPEPGSSAPDPGAAAPSARSGPAAGAGGQPAQAGDGRQRPAGGGGAAKSPRPVRVPTRRAPMMRRLLRENRGVLAGVGLSALVLAVLGLAMPLALSEVVGRLTAGQSTGSMAMIGVGGLAAISAVVTFARALAVSAAQRTLSARLASQTVARMLEAPYKFFTRRETGDLMARVSAADIIRDIVTSALVGLCIDAALGVSYLAIVLYGSPTLGLITLAAAAVQLSVATAVGRRTRLMRREEILAEGQSMARLGEAITGLPTLRVAAAEAVALERWQGAYLKRLNTAVRRMRITAWSDAVLAAGRVSVPVLLLLLAGQQTGLAPGRAIALAVLGGSALAPLTSLAGGIRALQEMGPMLDRLIDVAETPPEQPDERPAAPPLCGQITLRGVDFRYRLRAPLTLHGITVQIEAGMKVGIIGGSGSGKSTLATLLALLHPPTGGAILFDGIDARQMDLPSVRRQLGVVLQEPFLLAATVRDNITLGWPDTSDADIVHAAWLACIHADIAALPQGYDTMLGPGGTGLSGGQRQRIVLARALLRSPAVLILDEATSALDTAAEAAIDANLRAMTMTRIVIAHRLTTIADSDLLLVLENGRLVEQGSPAQLRNLPGGRYASLLRAGEHDLDIAAARPGAYTA
jgi:ABC-type bacteriocin/lantibiotic exporter with double-glycine peptidase domain